MSALLAWLGRNAIGRRREYQLWKRVSLVRRDPGALEALKSTGRCEVELPEELFDADYPGHFFRRLKRVGITIACVTGPYTINCTLTLLSSKVRTRSDSAPPYREQPPDPASGTTSSPSSALRRAQDRTTQASSNSTSRASVTSHSRARVLSLAGGSTSPRTPTPSTSGRSRTSF